MKRCPQCDFIYEDDQGLCDMDGSELERVREVSPGTHAAATRPPRPSALGRRSLRALLIAGVILGVVLSASYYVNTSQTATVPTAHAPAAASATTAATPQPASTPVPEVIAPQPELPPEPPPPATKVKPAAAASRNKRTSAAAPAGGPAMKPSPPQPAEREAKAQSPQGANDKKGSKLGAVLKKTGRILKKPFDF